MQIERTARMTIADLLDRSTGKMTKFCLGENIFIQGKIDNVQEDYLLVQRDPPTLIPIDKIVWLQFLE